MGKSAKRMYSEEDILKKSQVVASVNGKTGDVVLNTDDIKDRNTQSIHDNLVRIDENAERIEGRIDNPQTYLDMIKGTEFISVDLSENKKKKANGFNVEISFDKTNIDTLITFKDNQEVVATWDIDKKLELNLKQEITNKINNSLQAPLSLSEKKFVACEPITSQKKLRKTPNATSQLMIGVGDGLEIDENNNLNVTGGGAFSFVGMIIQGDEHINTEAQVKTIYGANTSWTKIEGKFLYGSDTNHAINTTGGEENHTLTINEMPNHSHSLANNDYPMHTYQSQGDSVDALSHSIKSNTDGNHISVDFNGGSQPHNNMPPYLIVNIWKRTA